MTYYLNPREVNEEARIFPQFETIKPLGLTITEFQENRLSVDSIEPGGLVTAKPPVQGSVHPGVSR